MSYEFITYEQKGRITYVTINRPERLNALHPPANAELNDAFTRFNDDPDAWVAILTGTGERAFRWPTATGWPSPGRPRKASGRACGPTTASPWFTSPTM